jgi:putative membrane-bound dehydrogenase-like protein
MKNFLWVFFLVYSGSFSFGQIAKPTDAPKPLPPEESAKQFRLPKGFQLELIATEPLIRQPSGMCWDERGRLFVCELHGYNLEGQYDIEKLNKMGKLDKVVRRLSADEEATRKAQAGQYGTVKQLIDTNGDGRMDKVQVWADRLPACFGICPARGGVIVICAPDIVFLADRDGDGKAEVREKLFTGFNDVIIERRMNSPQWGLDNWIYVARGRGGRITGPNLDEPVDLPAIDFRFKADGSAIEPISGGTGTFGFAFNAEGDRFTISTGTPGIQVAPLPWRYLARNPDAAIRVTERNAANYQRTYPISRPHPWREKRAADPGFNKYYRDRYGAAESTPNGFFTSACSPLIYQDNAIPGLRGHLLACAPAQNFVHRAIVERDGAKLNLSRHPDEEKSEFLPSSDIWFHPIKLAHGPAGGVWIADYYREIIEDYSAIPRYLQQQYGLKDGENHGRLWRLVHDGMPEGHPSFDMARLDPLELARETGSHRFWRRQTSRRLLVERGQIDKATLNILVKWVKEPQDRSGAINALYTLDGLGRLTAELVSSALGSSEPGVRRHALRLAEKRFDLSENLLKAVVEMVDDKSPMVRLQLALSLGESVDPRATAALAHLVIRYADDEWLADAILSSLGGRAGRMLLALLDKEEDASHLHALIERLCVTIANRRNPEEFSAALIRVTKLKDVRLQRLCLKGFRKPIKSSIRVSLGKSAREALKSLTSVRDGKVQGEAIGLVRVLKLESETERMDRINTAIKRVGDVKLSVEKRIAAVDGLAAENDSKIATRILDAFPVATPAVRRAILEAVFARSDYLPEVVSAVEKNRVPASALNSIQRSTLLQLSDVLVRKRAMELFKPLRSVDEKTLQRFIAALTKPRNEVNGEKMYRTHCSTCHHAHGVGFAVAPDLTSEFRRAEETIVRDILAPSEVIEPGHETWMVKTTDGRSLTGILSSESAASLVLSLPGGQQLDILRKEVSSIKALPVSLMPESLSQVLKPSDVADLIFWLRRPPARQVLFDDDPAFIKLLIDGKGTARIDTKNPYQGTSALRVTPPQRYSVRIKDWDFRIREKPGPGEYRYLQLAWKTDGAKGVLIELADNGKWPPAEKPLRRYYSGQNTTKWQATQISPKAPQKWTVITRDLWRDFGEFTLTGIAPTAMDGPVLFDRIELLRAVESD